MTTPLLNPETKVKDLPADIKQLLQEYLLTKSFKHGTLSATVHDGQLQMITNMKKSLYRKD